MKAAGVVLIAALTAGCGPSGPGGGLEWSNWDNTPQMLPAGFPFPLREEIVTTGKNRFWVFDYDLTGDSEADLRVWYLVRTHSEGALGERLAVVRNPHRVERLRMGLVAVTSKLDYQLKGSAEEIRHQLDGQMQTVWVK